MTDPLMRLYAALVGGGIPPGATASDLAWLERNHRWYAEHLMDPPFHRRQAFLCGEILSGKQREASNG